MQVIGFDMWRDCFSTFEFVEWTSEHFKSPQFVLFWFWMLIISLIHKKIVAWRVKFHNCTWINSKFQVTYNLYGIFAWTHIEYARNMVPNILKWTRIQIKHYLSLNPNEVTVASMETFSVLSVVSKDCTWNYFSITSRKTDFNGMNSNGSFEKQ